MVLPLVAGAIGLIGLGIGGFFAVEALSTLASWTAVGGAFAAGITVFYILLQENGGGVVGQASEGFNELFSSDAVAALTAAVVSVAVTGLTYKLLQSIFASLGWGAAVAASILVVAAVISSPVAVVNVGFAVSEGILGLLGGDN